MKIVEKLIENSPIEIVAYPTDDPRAFDYFNSLEFITFPPPWW